jgi:hypothetical protein
MHHPLGLIFPWTIVHAFGFRKNRQLAHFAPRGPGLSWYLNCFLLSTAACAGDNAAEMPSAANGMAAMLFNARPRETDFLPMVADSRRRTPNLAKI